MNTPKTNSRSVNASPQVALLITKLYIPPARPDLVPRPRLIERLDRGMERKLILISAPAGFGKTTLLSDWLHQSKMPVAWFSLDKGDNDAASFLTYVIAALQKIDTNIGKTAMTILQSPQPPPGKSVLSNLINDIAAVTQDFALVLEDYHLIEDKQIHSMVGFLLDNLPSQMHLIIASRSDPPLSLACLRGRNQMTELRAGDLCFTTNETSVFFNKVMNLGLSSENITLLESRTEGWITGNQLAALSMQGRDNISDFIKAFRGDERHIMDYLVDEVLDRQSKQVKNFLLQTSILNRMTGPLCDTVTGQTNSQQMLNELENASLFIVPLDSKRSWYRYHHLFADLLRYRLHRVQPDKVSELHSCACDWYEQNGLVNEAVSHALAVGDFQRAANLIEPVAFTMIAQNRISTLKGWFAKLPVELIADRLWLCVWNGWACLLTGQIDAVEPLLQSAESKLVDTSETKPSETITDRAHIFGHVMCIRAYIARGQRNIPRTIELSLEGLKHLPDDNLIARSALTLNLGYAYLISGELTGANQYLQQAATVGQAAGNFYVALAALGYLGDLQTKKWRLHQAVRIYRKALRLGTEWGGGFPLPATGFAHVGLGRVLYEWNDLDEATRHLTQAIELGEQANEGATALRGYLALALLKQANGEANAATKALDRAEEIAPRTSRIQESSQVSSWQARLWLRQGDVIAATRWAENSGLSLDNEFNYLSEFQHLTLARVLIIRNNPGQAEHKLNCLLKIAEIEKRTGSVIEILMLLALAL